MKKIILLILVIAPLLSNAQFADTSKCNCKISQPISFSQTKSAIVFGSLSLIGISFTQALLLNGELNTKDAKVLTYGFGGISIFALITALRIETEKKITTTSK